MSTRRAATLGLLVALLAALALAPAAPAAPRVFGVVTGAAFYGDPGDALDPVPATGAGWVREDIAWREVQPFPGVWDWRRSDRLVIAAAHRGLRLLPVLLGSPCWAAPPATPVDACARTLPAGDADFARFAARAAARYGPGGRFWAAHPRLAARLAPRTFEVWNEPDLPAPHAERGAGPDRYARLLAAAVRAGRAAAPGSRWLAAATSDVPDPWHVGEWITWAQGMVAAVPSIGAQVDGLAVHPYPAGRPASYLPQTGTDPSFHRTERIAAEFAAVGISRPVWITEVGYSACVQARSPRGWCVPGRTAAEREQLKGRWLGDLLADLDAPAYADVEAVFVYALREGGGTALERRFGLLDPRGRPLPAFRAFRAAALRADSFRRSRTRPGSP